ncbi:glucans biosynthesis protein [Stieleria neptunia]|uniref:Glucans biosynthesis protein n=1 Tax=Stieleria neptunia TaxID=2527979 RepID=A0A518HYV9_9BACT|nr:acyltransferase family protein [Stieleria neptunia]QDV45964.1 glucans biosynthesis protein [Stieleria neptunia]
MNHHSESAIVATNAPHRYHDLDAFRGWAVLLEIVLRNRMTLDELIPRAFADPVRYTASIIALKAVYRAIDALAMWTLVFGFLRFFQTYFHHPSARLRYISDSSYWLYLLHFPLTIWIAMYFSQLQLGPIAKFVCSNRVTLGYR